MVFLFVFIPLFVSVLVFSREETHIFINKLNKPALDLIMKWWTLLGDGFVLAAVTLLLTLFSFRLSLLTALSLLAGGLLAQFLKLVFFRSMPRPVKYFEMNEISYRLHLIPGMDIHSWMSFPSGHTTTAFAVCTAFAIYYSDRKILQLLFFTLALGVAISRVYLSQHFFMDVVGGAFLGLFVGYFSYNLIKKIHHHNLNKNLLNILS